ncbi:MAG: flagellar biosynthesis anti-sigma factor FlgM [Phycisphaerales bacterium]|jgi:anti-sigma28 factor (negative regulator of flagellin synthesis)|nr:flagellar biosynthesis anti-sigma factor FlgM [Phycisphaerales bacterium]
MSINSIGNNNSVQRLTNSPIQRQVPADAPKQLPLTDRLELSDVNHFMKALKSNDVRADKVASIRAQIETGTYEDDNKLNVAVDRLLDEMNQ